MLVCNKCYDIIKSKICPNCKSKESFSVDDGLATTISELNKQFKRLRWKLRTEFCCEGHTEFNGKYEFPHMYIRFRGTIKHLSVLSVEDLKKRIPYEGFNVFVESFPEKTYTISIAFYGQRPTLIEKKQITHVKKIFQDYFRDYIAYLETL